MRLESRSFSDDGVIPAEYAFCAPDARTHATLSRNRNPHFAWSGVPAGAKSLAIVCHDPDVPSRGDDVRRRFTGADVRHAVEGHVLAQASSPVATRSIRR